MKDNNKRRSFLKTIALGGLGTALVPAGASASMDIPARGEPAEKQPNQTDVAGRHKYNGTYRAEYLNRLAFPIGGMGAGMFCLEGTGCVSHMSVRNKPEVFHEPCMFASITVKGQVHGAKLLEGPVPSWKFFGKRGTGNGAEGSTFGLPRFRSAEFTTSFPFGNIHLQDEDIPLKAEITGWSPFIPTDEDNSSLPVGALEYSFHNNGTQLVEAVFAYNAKNFMASSDEAKNRIGSTPQGFVLIQDGTKEKPYLQGQFAVFTDQGNTVVDHCWFRGGWWDPLTMAWNNIRDGHIQQREPVDYSAPGASLYVPFSLLPGAKKTIRVMMAWYVPESNLQIGDIDASEKKDCDPALGCCAGPADLGLAPGKRTQATTYQPWYSSRFADVQEVASFWRAHYQDLQEKTRLFNQAFYASSLPPEVMEAVAANLTILKSPTVLRQYDGRLWSWEGCGDEEGCCHGSCTHVWNYAQAMPHLFPSLERTLRHTEFCENQNREGHQGFRANMPISPLKHDFHAAADGQLGGIMKVYRDWRISGDNSWMERLYPMVKKSMDYCISTWDPRTRGVVEEPHHNTYDIEFWGPDGMCTSFYLGALKAIIEMGTFLHRDISRYQDIYDKGRVYMETRLYNGAYFVQEIVFKGLNAPDPAKAQSYGGEYSPEAVEMLRKEGPKYQYGNGCLSDGVLGAWMARVCGLGDILDPQKIKSHVKAVHQYNLKKDLSEHANPQRPSYALGKEGGLLLCTWPKGGKLSLPFVYSDEVWTGIEYQVASHLLLTGKTREGLEVVRVCRDRYDGRVRNPFNEYECGHWYARAMSSYGLLQGLTGLRYDAVDQTLHIDSRIGDFTCFLSTATGFGTVKLKDGKPSWKAFYGHLDIRKVSVGGRDIAV